MNLSDYFSKKDGIGVLSTANKDGEVNSAIYSKPHVKDSNQILFIMRNKRTRANLQENPKANYLFVENDTSYKGVRITLTMTGESDDKDLIEKCSRRASAPNTERYLVTFQVNQASELVGDQNIELE